MSYTLFSHVTLFVMLHALLSHTLLVHTHTLRVMLAHYNVAQFLRGNRLWTVLRKPRASVSSGDRISRAADYLTICLVHDPGLEVHDNSMTRRSQSMAFRIYGHGRVLSLAILNICMIYLLLINSSVQ